MLITVLPPVPFPSHAPIRDVPGRFVSPVPPFVPACELAAALPHVPPCPHLPLKENVVHVKSHSHCTLI